MSRPGISFRTLISYDPRVGVITPRRPAYKKLDSWLATLTAALLYRRPWLHQLSTLPKCQGSLGPSYLGRTNGRVTEDQE